MANQVANYPVPMVFKSILLKKSSGELKIRGESFIKKLFFIDGKLELAVSNIPRERLANVLVIKGIIERERIEQLNLEQEGITSEKIGQRLVKMGLLTEEELYYCLVARCRLSAAAAFSLRRGEWEFVPGVPEIPGNRHFHIAMPRLIMDGVKNISDFSFYQNLFSNYIINVDRLSEILRKVLTPFSQQFYKSVGLISGQPARNILKILAIHEDIFWREVVMFYLLNIFQFYETGHLSSDTETFIVSQIRFQKRQRTGIMAKPRIARSTPVPVRIISQPSPPPLRRTPARPPAPKRTVPFWDSIQADEERTSTTVPIFTGARSPRDQSGTMPSMPEAVQNPKAVYQKACELYQEKCFQEAADLLDLITRQESAPSSYFYLLALCQVRLPNLRKPAERNLRIVADREPWNADPYYLLGEIYRTDGMVQLAERTYRQALEINPDHALAKKRLNEIRNR